MDLPLILCTSHDGYWPALRYVVVPSPKKLAASLDNEPVLWASPEVGGHGDPRVLCNEPLTAAAIQGRRHRAEQKAAEAAKSAARPSEMDVWPIVVTNRIRNTADDCTAVDQLIAYARNPDLSIQASCPLGWAY